MPYARMQWLNLIAVLWRRKNPSPLWVLHSLK
nr:MAG TPA: hypothetical protein [Caudoviricetes sp.]